MNRFIPAVLVSVAFFSLAFAAPAHAQRLRVPSSSYRPAPVSKPVESNYSSPSYSSGGHYYSSSSTSSYSNDDDRSSGVTFHLVCMVIILISIVIRVLCGIIGFFVWICRSVAG